ncbi:hypothetical protein HYALB_00005280 [Hymenoscyphus albidus]|uniref:Uncharacterized protein n=1 Tax=Hymenoscyphus albidus TaxID=595503 RepID=A0A9N9Q164_9HELO|nr:hypothetical protein HYALB_00005280 [Hymenoscyphus albidus]
MEAIPPPTQDPFSRPPDICLRRCIPTHMTDVKCKKAMGIHWDTWYLTEEPALGPAKILKDALVKAGIPETGTFDVFEPGESQEF